MNQIDKSKIRSSIAKILSVDRKAIPAGILMEKVKSDLLTSNKRLIYDVIDEMINKNELKKNQVGYLVEGYINTEILEPAYKGIIALNSQLDGYVKLVDENNQPINQEAYINNINLNGAISGDLVEIKYMKDKYNKAHVQHAIVTKVLDHNTKYVVGTFQLIGKDYNIQLDDTRNYLNVKLDNIDNLVNGHKLLIEIDHYKDNVAYGKVHKILGHINDIGIDVVSIIAGHNIEPEFSDEALALAQNMHFDENDHMQLRKDISDRLIVSIDPSTSKDLDDAIYVKKLDNGNYFLSVSIADVSNYVPFGSVLWEEAMKRSTSVYLVDRVIPMLPHYLSNNICSLNPDEYRCCLTCDIEIDANGDFKHIEVYPSKIKSHHRLSYDEVNQYFDHQTPLDNQALMDMLDQAKQLHLILRKRKQREGYIDFEIKEPKIIVNEKCWPIDIVIKQRGIAQKMIEDFMVAANEAVTLKATELNIPFIYRVHKKPDVTKLENFAIEAKKLGFITNKVDFENMQPSTIAKWLAQNESNENIDLISKLLLRCMQKAEYSTHNYGHFGLSSEYYTHFTSPIRRSSDTIVHLLYWMFVFNPNGYSQAQKDKLVNSLNEYCQNATSKEIVAVSTEREVNQLKFCQYMSDHINEVFDGTISMIKPFGIFIELDNTIEVLVRINCIGKDFWKYDDTNNTIVGLKTHKVFSFGQKVKVKITDVNILNKQINGVIVGYEPEIIDRERRNNNRVIKRY